MTPFFSHLGLQDGKDEILLAHPGRAFYAQVAGQGSQIVDLLVFNSDKFIVTS